MPTEIRHVIFSDAEIVEASVDYLQHTGRQLPPGTVDGFTMNEDIAGGDDSTLWLAIKFVHDKDGVSEKFPFMRKELFEALIGFCQKRGIPLPAGAEKVLQLIKDKIVLIMSMNLDLEKRKMMDDIRKSA